MGFNQSQIAKEVGVHKSTICREFKRNITFVRRSIGYWAYKPDYAQHYAEDRGKKTKRYFYKFTKEVEDFFRDKIKEDWSPEQISGYAKKWGLFSISHERIYQFVIEDKKKGGSLFKHLRHERWKSLLDNLAYVAIDKTQIVGFADMNKDYQKQGIPSKLVQQLERDSEKIGLKKITTEASITAKPFFEKMGYQLIKEQNKKCASVILKNYLMEKFLISN